MSAYKIAIDLTIKTMDRRAKCYRNLIAVVVIIILCSIASALITRTLEPLVGLLLIVPVCGFSFVLDGALLNDWRLRLFASWEKNEFDFWGFRDAMRVAPHLPKATLQGMVETLPSSPDWEMERAASVKTREAVVWVVRAISDIRANVAIVKMCVSGIVVVTIFFAAILWAWYPVIFILVILPFPLLIIWFKWWRLRKLRMMIAIARLEQEFNKEVFADLINHIDWRGMSLSEKTKFMRQIT